ncbi:hypothetical protein ACJMK2_006763 [Sinanodonta woodiana]|uniref:Phospholipid/glycerol acyltransferase domain-containing protein n=1 Tax=Sinanodonta woodiana TaxID=1069815 RepID=A0ABD3VU67_SINWO
MMESSIFAILTILLICSSLFFLLIIVLASLGKSLGLRRKYIQILLKVFEFGRRRIDSYVECKKHGEPDELEASDSSNEVIENESKNEEEHHLIERDISLSAFEGIKFSAVDFNGLDFKKEFHISDIIYFAKCGIEAVIEDDVTKCFTGAELKYWNLLTRTDKGYHFVSWRLTVLYCIGCFVRYCILLPFRVTLCTLGIGCLVISTTLIGYLKDGDFKRSMNERMTLMSSRILCRAVSGVVNFHNSENRAKNGICVANHTSPIDVILLSGDNCYAMVGQSHGGFLGIIMRAMARATSHIWFERSEVKDRHLVAKRMREHVEDTNKLPVLIFPEGTCVNNTSVMMFKKGGFEVSKTVYPVAIKYDPRFSDAYWNSSKMGLVRHVFDIMTSWALVVDVWYLPPMSKKDNEDAVQFANRVKSEIARRGGLVELDWDGQLKRMQAKESWKSKSQEDYSKILKVD